jgi:hypothetical protein
MRIPPFPHFRVLATARVDGDRASIVGRVPFLLIPVLLALPAAPIWLLKSDPLPLCTTTDAMILSVWAVMADVALLAAEAHRLRELYDEMVSLISKVRGTAETAM